MPLLSTSVVPRLVVCSDTVNCAADAAAAGAPDVVVAAEEPLGAVVGVAPCPLLLLLPQAASSNAPTAMAANTRGARRYMMGPPGVVIAVFIRSRANAGSPGRRG